MQKVAHVDFEKALVKTLRDEMNEQVIGFEIIYRGGGRGVIYDGRTSVSFGRLIEALDLMETDFVCTGGALYLHVLGWKDKNPDGLKSVRAAERTVELLQMALSEKSAQAESLWQEACENG